MTINANIRISAIVDQAVKALREVKAEAAGVASAATSKGKPAFSDVSEGASDAQAKTKAAREEAAKLRAEQRAAADEAKKRAADEKQRMREAKAAADDVLNQQRAAANQARQLAPQLTDIFVGLSTGQSPFTVLLQQGGQLKDVFGGVGNAVKAVASIFTAARVVIGGVVTALAAVAFEAFQGQQESVALGKTLALTGNIAATSAGQIDAQAKQISKSQNAVIGDVRATLAGLLASGEFTNTTLVSAGKAAVTLSKLTGQSAADSIKQFDGMSSGVAAWAAKNNLAYNFLTADQYKYIQSLEAQGRTQEAMKVTLDALNSTLEQRSAPAVGTLERAWNKVKETLSGVLDNLKAIGRDETPESRLEALQKRLQTLTDQRAKLQGKQDRTAQLQLANSDPEVARLNAEIAAETELKNRRQLAASERAIELQNEQDKILKASKSYTDAQASVALAGVQRELAGRLGALDQAAAAQELANAKGLSAAVDYNVALNKIDQQRLAAQRTALQEQLAIEAGRTVEKPQDQLAKDARVKELQGQLEQVSAGIAAAAVKGRAIVEADALDRARDKAQEWGAIWQRAADQVRTLQAQNATTAAGQISDPLLRASAEAATKVADLKRQVADLQRDLELRLSLTVDPEQRDVLTRQINDLAAQAKASIDETTRGATFASLQAQFAELTQTLTLQEQRLAIAVDQGALTTVDAEQRKFDARAKALPQLETILQAMQAIGSTPAEKNAIEGLTQDVVKLKDATTDFQKTARSSAVNSLSTALTDIETGAKKGKNALLDMVGSFAKALLDVLNKNLAEKLVKQFEGAAGTDSGGWFSLIGKILAPAHHAGGVVGAGGTGLVRSMSPLAWLGAPRYHGGGIVGERPIVALDGEEVLTEDNPRHIKNFKSSVGGIQINTTINGAQGSTDDQQGAAQALVQRVRAVVTDWAAEQKRPGGMLARG